MGFDIVCHRVWRLCQPNRSFLNTLGFCKERQVHNKPEAEVEEKEENSEKAVIGGIAGAEKKKELWIVKEVVGMWHHHRVVGGGVAK